MNPRFAWTLHKCSVTLSGRLNPLPWLLAQPGIGQKYGVRLCRCRMCRARSARRLKLALQPGCPHRKRPFVGFCSRVGCAEWVVEATLAVAVELSGRGWTRIGMAPRCASERATDVGISGQAWRCSWNGWIDPGQSTLHSKFV